MNHTQEKIKTCRIVIAKNRFFKEGIMQKWPLLLSIVLGFLSCSGNSISKESQPTFGIYLTKANIPPSSLAILSHVEPSADPVLLLQDISKYTWATHTIFLTSAGKKKLDTLAIPVHGRSFVVCVDNAPMYAGAFWTPVSSVSFSGITITIPKPIPDSLRIGRGYPTDSDTTSPDLRFDTIVQAALQNAGKLQ